MATTMQKTSSEVVCRARQALLARGVLTYAPSLSPAVHDALFSYWRLPLSVRERLAQRLPAIHLLLLPSESPVVGCAVPSLHVDWRQFVHCVDSNEHDGIANPMETAWAFALQAETIVEHAASELQQLQKRANVVTHGEHLSNLVGLLQDEKGEFYMAFVVLITILERALYDLYHEHSSDLVTVINTAETPSSASRKPTPNPKSLEPHAHRIKQRPKKKKNMILRDLLHSETLQEVLPEGLLRLLKVLFLPAGLNLRNLVWHGFMIPAEFPKCFSSLVVVLILALPSYSQPAVAKEADEEDLLFDIHSYNERFILQDRMQTRFDSRLRETLLDACHQGSPFIPRGRENLARKALTSLTPDTNEDELWFLFALLPVLEHALRIKFVTTNERRWGISSEYGQAQIDAYYSTLDGFGQRDKHQVLLHPHVILDTKQEEGAAGAAASSMALLSLNQLYATLPPAALAVCLDLFMMSTGPNLRAKLCHGEADLSGLLPRAKSAPRRPRISTASQLVLLAWLSLCGNDEETSPSVRDDRAASRSSSQATMLTSTPTVSSPTLQPLVQTFEQAYSSSFHPFYQLHRALASAYELGRTFAAMRSQWTTFRLEIQRENDREAMTWVEFPSVPMSEEGGTTFGLEEKTSRVREFQGLLRQASAVFSWNNASSSTWVSSSMRDSASSSKLAASGFPALLEQLFVKLDVVAAQLRQHFQGPHAAFGGKSAFLELLGHTGSNDAGGDTPHLFDDRSALDRATEAYVLALSDDDGLSVASCMLEIVGSAHRSLETFQRRFRHLQQMVVAGKARTNHRRSFLNSVFFSPVFERVQLLTLSLVEHQIMHLLSLAMRSSSSGSDPRIGDPGSSCSQARAFESLQPKLLQFITAFEGCTGNSDAASQKSGEKALRVAIQFLDSKAMKAATRLPN